MSNDININFPLYLTLSAHGNPDHGQDPDRLVAGVPHEVVEVNSLEEASQLCSNYIDEHVLGAGSFSGGALLNAEGVEQARVSYNGKVWPPGRWERGREPLWDPYTLPEGMAPG